MPASKSPQPDRQSIEDSLPAYDQHVYDDPPSDPSRLLVSSDVEGSTLKPRSRWWQFWRFSERAKMILGAVILALAALVATMIWYGVHRAQESKLDNPADLSAARKMVEPKVSLFVFVLALATGILTSSPSLLLSLKDLHLSHIFRRRPPHFLRLLPSNDLQRILHQHPSRNHPHLFLSAPPSPHTHLVVLLLRQDLRTALDGHRLRFFRRQLNGLECEGRRVLEGLFGWKPRCEEAVGIGSAFQDGGRIVRVQDG